MKPRYSLILDDEFIQYCKLNDIEDIEKKAKELFAHAFTLLKYGSVPKASYKIEEFLENPIHIPYIPVTFTPPPEPQKEEVCEIQPKNKDIVLAEAQPHLKTPKKDLYDEG